MSGNLAREGERDVTVGMKKVKGGKGVGRRRIYREPPGEKGFSIFPKGQIFILAGN